MDVDIIDSQTNERAAETALGGTIPVPKSDKKSSLAQIDLGVDRDITNV